MNNPTIKLREKRTGDIKTAHLQYSSRFLTKVYHVDGEPLSDKLLKRYYEIVPESKSTPLAGFVFDFFKSVYNVPA